MPESMRSLATAGRRTLRADRTTLLISLLMGVLIWIYVDTRRTEQRVLEVPLECRAPAEWQLRPETVPATVAVHLRGPSVTLAGLRPEEMRFVRGVTVPPDAPDEVEKSLELLPTDLRGLPPETEVLEIEPPRLTVNLVRLVRSFLPIQVVLEGVPDPGYTVEATMVEPMRIALQAPRGILEPSDAIRTRPVDVSGARNAVARNVALQPFRKGDRVFEPNELVYVTVEVVEKLERQTYENVPVRVLLSAPLDAPEAMDLYPPNVTVVLEGRGERLGQLKAADIYAFVDLRNRVPKKENVFLLTVESIAPDGTKTVRVEPKQVEWHAPPPPLKPAPPPAGTKADGTPATAEAKKAVAAKAGPEATAPDKPVPPETKPTAAKTEKAKTAKIPQKPAEKAAEGAVEKAKGDAPAPPDAAHEGGGGEGAP